MRIPVADQYKLLDLQDVDRQLAKATHALLNLKSAQQLRELQHEAHNLKVTAVRTQTEADDFGRQARRVDEDLERVRARHKRNTELADSGVDARVQRELEHESESLKRRQLELEDAEMSFLERQEKAMTAATEMQARSDKVQQDLQELEVSSQQDKAEAKTKVVNLRQERVDTVTAIPAGLVKLYDQAKAQRGIGVARLEGNQCSACRIEMTATEVDRFAALDPEVVEQCEECGCPLIREG
jgi:predicted  nucleic acid-binding Zn-ribbon protein